MASAGDLQEISVAIGRLQAQVESASASRQVTYSKIEDIAKSVSRMEMQLVSGLNEIAALKVDVAAIKPEVELWRGLRNRAMGGMTAAGLLLAGSGAAAWEAISKLLFRGS